MSETLVEIRDLSFARGRHVIYDGISMSFKRGAVAAVMGPSGTGKTTLLRLIGGQLSRTPATSSMTVTSASPPWGATGSSRSGSA